MNAKHYKKLRKKMSPKARQEAAKKTKSLVN
jgi:hypothetical protein